MTDRIQIDAVLPDGYRTLFALEKYVRQSDLSTTELHLIKLRASQLNGCAFCIDMHTGESLATGESQQRIMLLSAWRETTLYTDRERALLALTEEVTLIAADGLTATTYQDALAELGDTVLAQAILAIIAINSWNRVAVATHKPLPRK